MKKYISLMLILCMVVSLFVTVPIAVNAESADELTVMSPSNNVLASDCEKVVQDIAFDKGINSEDGFLYTKFVIDEERNLSKCLYVDEILISEDINDFCLVGRFVYYCSNDTLYCYSFENADTYIVYADIQLRNMIVHRNYLYGVNDHEGLSQICVIDLLNNELLKTNYTNVNSFTISDNRLNIDVMVDSAKIQEAPETTFAVSEQEAINGSSRDRTSLFSLKDAPVLRGTVTLSSIQQAKFVMDTLNVTQGGHNSNANYKAFDFGGNVAGTTAEIVKAPFDGIVKYKETDWNTVWVQSNSIVQYANGTTGYMTVLFMHDNDISNVYVGMPLKQGQSFYNEGGKGPNGTTQYATHLHLECMSGQVGSKGWSARGNIYPNDALYIDNATVIKNKGGYTWRNGTQAQPDNSGDGIISNTNQVLRYGDENESVRQLQTALNKVMNAGLTTDGKYGQSTHDAVKAFQSKYGLAVDGDAGPSTLKKLNELAGGHTHSFPTITHEAAHPHREFKACTCGYTEYTGKTVVVNTCSQCTTPGKPSLLNMSDSYCANEEIAFSWNKTVNTTHYNLYIHQKNSTGEYESYKNTFYAESGMSLSLPVGEYQVFLQSTNSNARTDDGSTWRFTNSKVYYFTVTDQRPIADITTTSGGYIPVGTNVTFDFEIENARYWYFIVTDENDERILVELATGKWNYDYTFNEPGKYKVELQTANGNGWTNVPIDIVVLNTGGSCGSNANWTLDDEGVLRICGTGEISEMDPYPWEAYKEDITQIIIYDGITNIPFSAFGILSQVETIEIPGTVETIGHSAFNGCKKLKNLEIPEGVKTIGGHAIQHCYELKTISIPSTLTDLNAVDNFFRCNSLIEINVAQGNANYSSLNGVLFNKDQTTLLCYPDGKTESSYTVPDGVIEIAESVFEDDNLTIVNIPSSVKKINGDFHFLSCISLVNINVDQNNSSYSSLDGVLFNKDKTEIIYYPRGKTEISYTIPDNTSLIAACAFSNSVLNCVTIPASVREIGNYAFPSTLTDVYFAGTEEEWDNIDVEYTKTEGINTIKLNESLRSATKHFESVATISVSGITINKNNVILSVGETEALTATISPSNATNQTVYWESSDPSVVSVLDGVVTAKAAGTATITVSTADGNKSATCTVVVEEQQPSSGNNENCGLIKVNDAKACVGKTVDVVINIENNPGIAILGFNINYDKTAMTLKSATLGEIFIGELECNIASVPFVFNVYSGSENKTNDGKLVTLQFEIKSDCAEGDYAISLSDIEALNIAENDVTFETVNGTITITNSIPGDVTEDGKVTRADLLRLAKSFSGFEVEMDMTAADVTADGKVTRADLLRLAKHFSGFDVELGK